MPWTAADADRYNKGLTSGQKKKWATIANEALKQGKGEGYAIRVANAKVRESDDDFDVRSDIEDVKQRRPDG
jgi:uncharacterized protein YdaT